MAEINVLDENLDESAAYLRERMEGRAPKVGLILGSGPEPFGQRRSGRGVHPVRGGAGA